MKIIHICMGFPVEYQGGITNYVRSLATEQVKRGDEVVIYCNGDCETLSKAGYLIKRYNSIIRPLSLGVKSKDNSYLSFFLRLEQESADVYHIHSLLGVDPRIADAFSMSKLNYVISLHDYNLICPRVFMVNKVDEICHDLDLIRCEKCIGVIEQQDFIARALKKFGVSIPTFPSKNIYYRYSKYERLLTRAKRLLPVSSRVGEIFATVSINNQEVITIGNDTAYNKRDERKSFDSGCINIAFLGSFTRIKGGELFIELCKKNTNKILNFVFYGRGDKALLKEFEACGGKNYGPYESADLPTILNSVHIGAVLSIWEDNGPQVVMEMINNYIPVLGTKRGGIPDFITSENGLIFDPDTELDKASVWLNSLTVDNLKDYHANIKALKTPIEHCEEVERVYLSILSL